MPKNPDAQFAIETLIEMGVLSEAGLAKLGQLFRGVQALRGDQPVPYARGPGRPPASSAGQKGSRRGRRGILSAVSAAEFKAMYITQGMTAKEIAAKVGVSAGAVALRASKMGLKKNKPAGTKKARKKAGKKARGKQKAGKKKAKGKSYRKQKAGKKKARGKGRD